MFPNGYLHFKNQSATVAGPITVSLFKYLPKTLGGHPRFGMEDRIERPKTYHSMVDIVPKKYYTELKLKAVQSDLTVKIIVDP